MGYDKNNTSLYCNMLGECLQFVKVALDECLLCEGLIIFHGRCLIKCLNYNEMNV
jgi:hypothetical protein